MSGLDYRLAGYANTENGLIVLEDQCLRFQNTASCAEEIDHWTLAR